ncbi:hypothetical protein PSAC2689_50295 [Paraburkholderia sacchari]
MAEAEIRDDLPGVDARIVHAELAADQLAHAAVGPRVARKAILARGAVQRARDPAHCGLVEHGGPAAHAHLLERGEAAVFDNRLVAAHRLGGEVQGVGYGVHGRAFHQHLAGGHPARDARQILGSDKHVITRQRKIPDMRLANAAPVNPFSACGSSRLPRPRMALA